MKRILTTAALLCPTLATATATVFTLPQAHAVCSMDSETVRLIYEARDGGMRMSTAIRNLKKIDADEFIVVAELAYTKTRTLNPDTAKVAYYYGCMDTMAKAASEGL